VEAAGAGLALAPNGLSALDTMGVGDAVRAHGDQPLPDSAQETGQLEAAYDAGILGLRR
jgi:2-polyprenyl-6-methoxyphenol hydroxylase-like FAD-dependent oxidoreductase